MYINTTTFFWNVGNGFRPREPFIISVEYFATANFIFPFGFGEPDHKEDDREETGKVQGSFKF